MSPTPTQPYSQGAHSEETDLFDILQSLWDQKFLLGVCIAISTGLALLYAYLSVSVYEAKASLLPPTRGDISGYNLGRSGVSTLKPSLQQDQPASGLVEFTVDDVYAVFTRNLRSESLRKAFFKDTYLPTLPPEKDKKARDKLWDEFDDVLKVINPDPKLRPEYFEVVVEHSNPNTATEWVNLYVMRAAKQSEASMMRSASSEVQTRIGALHNRIEALRMSAERDRIDREAVLREALQIAEAVGLEAPVAPTGRATIEGNLQCMDDGLAYMRGTKALSAELAVLAARKSNDPFIHELSELKTQLAFYKQINVSPESVAVFTLDTPAEVPETPSKPQKLLLASIGFVLGGMLGVFIALVRLMRTRHMAVG